MFHFCYWKGYFEDKESTEGIQAWQVTTLRHLGCNTYNKVHLCYVRIRRLYTTTTLMSLGWGPQ